MVRLVSLQANCSYPDYNSFGDCSGHGVCVDSVCVCDKYYNGRSDWMNLDGIACQVNGPAIRVLWGIVWLIALYIIKQCLKVIRTELAATKGSWPGVWARMSGKTTITSFVLSCLIMVVAIAKTCTNENIDPVDSPVIYACYVCTSISFYWLTIYITKMQLNLALKGMNSKKGGSDMDNINKVMKLMNV